MGAWRHAILDQGNQGFGNANINADLDNENLEIVTLLGFKSA
ncbi:hypothetical protein HMP0015_1649 [Acinetobacter haemolyticus ATCC 19194]|uniref:Uncharacterized protein n=1 Tax=Acinetobacter haemolyticus ATCC 19194 TaxID=707232 RepID=D4XPK7_ACIHA|nr:hypothetical protein HMPREF0023_1561 [Acinetobacter sp. ATCC 27244]EFF82879.1 hypothetical protein HMP0015_1649 [Acinetobacter haemolyticus ATCC 19194]